MINFRQEASWPEFLWRISANALVHIRSESFQPGNPVFVVFDGCEAKRGRPVRSTVCAPSTLSDRQQVGAAIVAPSISVS